MVIGLHQATQEVDLAHSEEWLEVPAAPGGCAASLAGARFWRSGARAGAHDNGRGGALAVAGRHTGHRWRVLSVFPGLPCSVVVLRWRRGRPGA